MRRFRKNIFDDEQEVGRWLISYADFITLLFAFFVVMYSISQVNENKYKLLSNSLVNAFDTPPSSSKPIQIGEVSRSILSVGDNVEPPDQSSKHSDSKNPDSGKIDSENFASVEEFKALETGLRKSLGDLIDQELAEIKSDANWININLRSSLLFPSGSDALNDGADPLLEEVAAHLNTNSQLILVHGHTDNIPINTERFPSNWELSSARGVAVVRKLQNLSVFAPRLSVEGHGEFQPIASNDTVEGRAKNRRVVIAISRKQAIQRQTAVAESTKVAEPKKTQKDIEQEFKIVRLPGGGILIRGKDLPNKKESPSNDNK
ncbi:flagellar motor protein MotB [Aliikangiella sp. IMCC44359]|uniref:flagellar motor protein MotB n=1 Tax=Aliikangiella sp. IMCC44359 TaxID=3459125 RepID=UPI00403AE565